MNTLRKLFAPLISLLAVCAICVAPLVACSGCKTSQQTVAFKVAKTVEISADTAMSAWGDYVGKFHPSASVEQKVSDAFTKYQKAMITIADAGEQWTAKIGTIEEPTSQQVYNAAIAAGSAALADLVDLVRSFGVKFE